MAPKKAVAKKPAAKSTKKVEKASNPLYPSTPRSTRVGGDIRPKGRDLSRFVRWPKYVRVQRQKRILLQRMKVPPAICTFQNTMDKNQAAELFKLLVKIQPETKAAKADRIEAAAKAVAAGEAAPKSAPGPTLKYGLKHVTTLVEQKKASLVCIAHDVDPIELVIWLPALCRKMNVPFCIVKGKGRLGTLTHKKNAAVVAVTNVASGDEGALKKIQESCMENFNNNIIRKWGGGEMGLKTKAKLEKRRLAIEAEMAKKNAAK